jgi:hypothetical protein
MARQRAHEYADDRFAGLVADGAGDGARPPDLHAQVGHPLVRLELNRSERIDRCDVAAVAAVEIAELRRGDRVARIASQLDERKSPAAVRDLSRLSVLDGPRRFARRQIHNGPGCWAETKDNRAKKQKRYMERAIAGHLFSVVRLI